MKYFFFLCLLSLLLLGCGSAPGLSLETTSPSAGSTKILRPKTEHLLGESKIRGFFTAEHPEDRSLHLDIGFFQDNDYSPFNPEAQKAFYQYGNMRIQVKCYYYDKDGVQQILSIEPSIQKTHLVVNTSIWGKPTQRIVPLRTVNSSTAVDSIVQFWTVKNYSGVLPVTSYKALDPYLGLRLHITALFPHSTDLKFYTNLRLSVVVR